MFAFHARSLIAALCLTVAAAIGCAPAWAARPVLKHESAVTLKASPKKAWDSFKTFGAIHEWHPATEGTTLLVGENGKPLAVREFQLKGGGFVISELLAYDEARKHFKYRIIKTNLPLANYVAEMWVTPAAGGGSVVHWRGRFQRPEETPQAGQGDDDTMKLVQGVFKAGLDNIAVITSR